MWKNKHIFLLILLVSLLVQGTIWYTTEPLDASLWIKRVNNLSSDLRNNTHSFDQEKYSEHPGMPVLMLASLTQRMGYSAKNSLHGALTIVISIIFTWLIFTLKIIRPNSLWWLAAGGIIIFHPLYYQGSPVDAVIAPLTVLMMVLILQVIENKQQFWPWIALTIAIGIALSTRMQFTIIFITPAIILLTYYKGFRYTSTMTVGSLLIAFIFNPLLWYTPQIFLKAALINQISFFTGSTLNNGVSYRLLPVDFITHSPLSLLSILLFIILYTFRRHILEISNSFILIIILCTIFPATILLISHLQSLRYFSPLFFLWEAFLPLWLLQTVKNINFKNKSQSHNNEFRQSLGNFIVFLLVTSQIMMVLYIYYLPIALRPD